MFVHIVEKLPGANKTRIAWGNSYTQVVGASFVVIGDGHGYIQVGITWVPMSLTWVSMSFEWVPMSMTLVPMTMTYVCLCYVAFVRMLNVDVCV